MTITELIENTVSVAGKPIFVAETGSGPAVVMLHGGGPGASGVSNYSRNIYALAQQFRVIVPDMPGYGRSAAGTGHTAASRQARPDGSRRHRHHARCPHCRAQKPAVVLRRWRTQPGEAGSVHPQL